MKVKTFQKTFWAYFSSLIFLGWITLIISLAVQIPKMSSEETENLIVGTILMLVLGIIMFGFAITLSKLNEKIKTIKFKIISIDIWSHDSQKYITKYFVNEIEERQKIIYQWRYKLYTTDTEPDGDLLLKKEEWRAKHGTRYETKEEAMKSIIEWVKSTLDREVTNKEKTFKNVLLVDEISYEDVVKIIKEEK